MLPGPPARLFRARLRCGAGVRAAQLGYPGFAGLGLPADEHPEWSEPYIYHFPDGNASLARLLVRALVAGRCAGPIRMDDIVLAGFDYDALDRDDSSVRIRLKSTVVDVRQRGEAVSIGYVRGGAPHRVTAKHAVLACFHMMIPYLMPDLPQAQREALARNVKTPLVYTNVVVRNWQPWLALKVSDIAAPMSFLQSRRARLSGRPRRLSPSARSGGADRAPSRARAGRTEFRARRARPISHRSGASFSP